MARNRKDRQETVDDSGELVQQEGKWLKRIPHEEAFRIRCDVQLYARSKFTADTRIRKGEQGPAEYRRRSSWEFSHSSTPGGWWWTDYVWYIEVGDPTKPEYVSDEETC